MADSRRGVGGGGGRDERRWEGRGAQPFSLSDGGDGGDGGDGDAGRRDRRETTARVSEKVLRPVQRRPQRQ